jgi:regulator of protease activity HflC (stomatin/prohibitin superfamily)
MKEEELRAQINALIRDEIQEGINDYIDTKEESEKTGLGFVDNKDEELKVNISNAEVDKLIKEYKKIKKRQKSNINQIRLLDKFGNPIKKP